MTDISLEISMNNYMNDCNHICSLKYGTDDNETNSKLNMVTNNDSKSPIHPSKSHRPFHAPIVIIIVINKVNGINI